MVMRCVRFGRLYPFDVLLLSRAFFAPGGVIATTGDAL